MITLYHFERSGNAREVRLVLHEKGLEFDEVIIDVRKGENRTPEFLALNPFGTVPVLVDDDLVLYESRVINEYLEERYPHPPLMPSEPAARAEVRKWAHWGSVNMSKHLAPVLLEMLLKPEPAWDRAMIDGNKEALLGVVRTIDGRLEGRDFLCGDYSLADVALTPHLAAAGRIQFRAPAELERFHAWMSRLRARPNFKASVSH